jgi:hypothetical protein
MFVCCECCVLLGRGICDGLITRPEESYQLWRVVCNQETSKNEEAKARYRAAENTTTMGCNTKKTNKQTNNKQNVRLYLMDESCCDYMFRLVNNRFEVSSLHFLSRI